MPERLRELHRLEAELTEHLERLRQVAEGKPHSIISALYWRMVTKCEAVQADVAAPTWCLRTSSLKAAHEKRALWMSALEDSCLGSDNFPFALSPYRWPINKRLRRRSRMSPGRIN